MLPAMKQVKWERLKQCRTCRHLHPAHPPVSMYATCFLGLPMVCERKCEAYHPGKVPGE